MGLQRLTSLNETGVCVGKMVSSDERCRERDSEPEGEPFLTIKGKAGERPCTHVIGCNPPARFNMISKFELHHSEIHNDQRYSAFKLFKKARCLITTVFFLVFKEGTAERVGVGVGVGVGAHLTAAVTFTSSTI